LHGIAPAQYRLIVLALARHEPGDFGDSAINDLPSWQQPVVKTLNLRASSFSAGPRAPPCDPGLR
jgi:hypothetical protein